MASIGRNDPCPCGSGRKYKHCCLQHYDADRIVRARLREAESRVVPAVLDFALGHWGEPLLESAWKAFVLWSEDVPERIPDDPDFYPLFLPWFVFTHRPDRHDDDLPDDLPEVPLALAYLEEHDEVEDLDRRLIEAACRSGFTFQAVRKVAGEAIELKDILTGTEVRVLEKSGAESVSAGDILFAFVAGAAGGAILLGCAPLVIPPPWHTRIIEFREETWEGRRPSPADLSEYEFEIREFYYEVADAIFNPQPPTLSNTDGEPIQLTTVSYDLRCTADEAFEAFKNPVASDRPQPQTDEDDVERNDDGTIARATVRWLNDKEMLLGTVTIEAGMLRAEVNSAERAARIQQEIASKLGDRATLVNTDTLSAEEMMAQLADADAPDRGVETHEERPPEFAAIEAEMMAKHWETWLDEPVPALADETPRQAAASALGRERLKALLAEYGWRDERQPPHLRADIAALKEKLGL